MIDKIINYFKRNNPEEINDYYSKKYESKLYKKYGDCNPFTKKIRILAIADTHGTLDEDKFKEFIKHNNVYDLVVMIGDHYTRDIDIIVDNVDKSKLVGILGNHDYNYLSEYNIPNINGKIITINGVRILGMQGSFKYKQVDFPSFTQDESINFLNQFDAVDILISHDKKFDPDKLKDPAHQGLIGITNYIYEKKVPYHIHGHIHEPYHREMLNKTKEISVFGYEMIDLNTENNI